MSLAVFVSDPQEEICAELGVHSPTQEFCVQVIEGVVYNGRHYKNYCVWTIGAMRGLHAKLGSILQEVEVAKREREVLKETAKNT